jgi:hypothetical protein
MEAINRAIEDVADFREFMQRAKDSQLRQLQTDEIPASSPKQAFENREQYRARMKAERRAMSKEKA